MFVDVHQVGSAKMYILSNSAKFSAGRPTLPVHNFSVTMATTYTIYRLGAVSSLNFLAIENMPPHFSAHVYYGQTAGWIKIPLGTDVGLGPGDIVLDGIQLPIHAKGHNSPPPQFSAHWSGPHSRRPAFYP